MKIKQIEVNPKTQGYIDNFFKEDEREKERKKRSLERKKRKGVRSETRKTKSNL